MKKLNQTESVLRQEILARKLATESQLDGDLSISFMQNCHSKVNLYLSLVRPADVDAAYDKPNRIAASKAEAQRLRTLAQFKDGNFQYSESAIEEIQKFVRQYKQFDSSNLHDREAILKYLKEHKLPVRFQEIVKAFEALVISGTLTLIPEAIGLPEAELTGYALQHSPDLSTLLKRHPYQTSEQIEQQRIAGLSADDYAAQYLHEDTIPPVIQARIERDVLDFCKRHPEYDPSAKGKAILLDYIRSHGWLINHDSLEASYAANKDALHSAGAITDEGPSIPVRYNASTLVDHRKPHIPQVQREITLEPSPTVKRVDMEKLLALPADEFRRVVNGTPGLRELLDGEQK